MSSIGCIGAAILILSSSGFPALLFSRSSSWGQRLATLLLVLGSLVGLAGLGLALAGGSARSYEGAWLLPWGAFSIAVDRVSLVFLAPVFVVPALGSVYALGYWRQEEKQDSGRRLGLSYGILAGAMGLVLVSRDAVLFLFAWEAMALAAWFASTAESSKPEVRRAGWVYLIATHLGTLCLFAMFSVWRSATGSFSLVGAAAMEPAFATAVFVLALLGFGLKAGLMPLHVWLPGAHANAPSHVSALMSGVMLTMGLYGITRVTGLLPEAVAWWGWVLLSLGAVSGLVGIALALGQGDIKRLLAYSSVENIGIMTMGLGLAVLGRASGRPELVLLGLGGSLLHAWNHGLFKPLLFLGAGAVARATGTRDSERLGGLAGSMPLTAALFALGAVSIAALPPLNGFVGELLLYLGFFRVLGPGASNALAVAAAGAAVLATIGAIALATFVKAHAGIFLGAPRVSGLPRFADPPASMTIPMILLALACLALGLFPGPALALVGQAAGEWGTLADTGAGLEGLVDLGWPPATGLALIAISALLLALLGRNRRRRAPAEAPMPTWDCGYALPTAMMQYTPSSFAAFLARGLSFILPRRRKESLPTGHFPLPGAFSSRFPDPVLDLLLRPLSRKARGILPAIRAIQQGQTQIYLVYILVVTVILLVAGVGLS